MLIAIAVGLSCASVAITGGIGFIGFAAPHLAKRLVGTMHQHIIPIAGLIFVILVAADTIGLCFSRTPFRRGCGSHRRAVFSLSRHENQIIKQGVFP